MSCLILWTKCPASVTTVMEPRLWIKLDTPPSPINLPSQSDPLRSTDGGGVNGLTTDAGCCPRCSKIRNEEVHGSFTAKKKKILCTTASFHKP